MIVIAYLVLLALCSVYAWWKGGAPERWGVAILLGSVGLSEVIPPTSGLRFGHIEFGYMVSDLLMFVAIVVVALRAQRYWPMYMAAILISTLITHLLMLSPRLMPFSYAVMLGGWTLLNPPLLAVGAWRHQRRIMLYGADPDWSVAAHRIAVDEHGEAAASLDAR